MSDSDRLDDVAVSCVAKWHYRPALRDSAQVYAPVSVNVVWALSEPDEKKPDVDRKLDASP